MGERRKESGKQKSQGGRNLEESEENLCCKVNY